MRSMRSAALFNAGCGWISSKENILERQEQVEQVAMLAGWFPHAMLALTY